MSHITALYERGILQGPAQQPHRRQDKAGCPSILHRYAARGTSSKLLVS